MRQHWATGEKLHHVLAFKLNRLFFPLDVNRTNLLECKAFDAAFKSCGNNHNNVMAAQGPDLKGFPIDETCIQATDRSLDGFLLLRFNYT